GAAMVAWMQYVGDASAVYVSERNPRGAWTDPRGASDAFSFPPRAYEPRLAIGRDGETLLVWNQWRGERYGVALATREVPGANWTRPSSANDVLSPPVFFSNGPQIALGPRGDAVATWYQSLGGPLRVLVSERRGRHGSFLHADPTRALSAADASVDSNP